MEYTPSGCLNSRQPAGRAGRGEGLMTLGMEPVPPGAVDESLPVPVVAAFLQAGALRMSTASPRRAARASQGFIVGPMIVTSRSRKDEKPAHRIPYRRDDRQPAKTKTP